MTAEGLTGVNLKKTVGGTDMAVSRIAVLKLYKTMMREAFQFQSYNFRMYALRRIRDGFHSNKNVRDEKELAELMRYANEHLEIMKKQTVVGKLYAAEKLIIEKCSTEQS